MHTCPYCGTVKLTKRPLTVRQREVLGVIERSIRERGVAPSFQEIAEALGVRSLATVHEHLQSLERKGHIRREPQCARAIIVEAA